MKVKVQCGLLLILQGDTQKVEHTLFTLINQLGSLEMISLDHCNEGWSRWTLQHSVQHDHLELHSPMLMLTTKHIKNMEKQECQPLLKAKYCPRDMPAQHFVNPGQLVHAVPCTQKAHKNPCDPDFW